MVAKDMLDKKMIEIKKMVCSIELMRIAEL